MLTWTDWDRENERVSHMCYATNPEATHFKCSKTQGHKGNHKKNNAKGKSVSEWENK